MKPLYNRLIVEPIENPKEEKGFIVPDTAKERPQEAIVVSVGDECAYVKQGDKVSFGKFAGTELIVNNKTLVLLKETEVFLIL